MTAFTVTTAKNIDELASKTGGDTYAINGGTLTVDQDSRYGTNQSTAASLGSITLSNSLGGTVEVDARAVRLIPYNSGSGNVPAANTVISQGGVTGKLIGVWSAINVAPTAAGSAMPASGFIKVKQVSGAYSSGTLTGVGASATGVDVVGWIELVGDEGSTVVVPRLGSFRMRGDWFDVGTTTGVNTNTYQLPTSGSKFYAAGVWVETGSGTGIYEFYPCAGSLVASASVGTDAVRGKVCWISTAGVLRLGHDGTNANTGYCPPAGRKVRIPNIICQNSTTAARTANALPNATLATRYDFTTTGGGQISIDKALLGWYPSFTQAYSVALSYVGILEQLVVTSSPSPLNLTQVGVGQCAAQVNIALDIQYLQAGGTFNDCVWTRATQAGSLVTRRQNIANFTFNRERIFSFTNRTAASGAYSDLGAINSNCTYNDCIVGQAPIRATACVDLTYNDTTYFDCITGTTQTAQLVTAFIFTNLSSGITVDGFAFGGTNVQCYGQIVSIDASSGGGSNSITLQNIGTYVSPLDCGSINACAGLITVAPAMGATNLKRRRCYLSNTRLINDFNSDNLNVGYEVFNVFGDYSDAFLFRASGAKIRGCGGTPDLTPQTGYYGTHWMDWFTSTTSGRLVLLMSDPNEVTASLFTLSGGAKFNGAGGVILKEVSDAIVAEMDYYAIGHTGFVSTALVMGGGTATKYDYRYQIDKNDGGGWSAWSDSKTPTTLGAALNAETGIDATKGCKLKLEIKTNTTNTDAVTSVYLVTTSTTTTQAYQHPLDVATVTVDGLVDGSMCKASKVSDGTVIFTGAAVSGAISFTTEYFGLIEVEARKASSAPYYRPWASRLTTVSGSTVSATAIQILD